MFWYLFTQSNIDIGIYKFIDKSFIKINSGPGKCWTQMVCKHKEYFILQKSSMLGSPIMKIKRQPSEVAGLL